MTHLPFRGGIAHQFYPFGIISKIRRDANGETKFFRRMPQSDKIPGKKRFAVVFGGLL
jgi:hypothetical protein